MPRNAAGTFSLAKPPFVAGTTIKSADVNADLSDIATGLTQSLATNGVSSMTGPIKAASGSLGAPSYSFVSALHTGFYLAGTDQIGWSYNSTLGATFNNDGTVTWAGGATWAGDIGTTGNFAVLGDVSISGSIVASNAAFSNWMDLSKQVATPASPAANKLRFYVKLESLANGERPYVVDESGIVSPLLFAGGQCQLVKDGANLRLNPYKGNRLSINGTPQIIPTAGVSLAASNSGGVFVYIYAFMNAGTMTLELSTTVPVLQADTGIKQKTGDATRTLVGAAYTDTGGAWADTDGKLWVISYFNRRRKSSKTTLIASAVTATSAYFEVDASMRNQFINWVDETVFLDDQLYYFSNVTQVVGNQISIDGTTNSGAVANTGQTNFVAISNVHAYITGATITEAALHYATIFAFAAAGTTVTYSNASVTLGTQLYVNING